MNRPLGPIDPLDAWVLADFEAVERESAPSPEQAWTSVEGFIDSAVAWLARRDLSGEILGEIGRRLAVGRAPEGEVEAAAEEAEELSDAPAVGPAGPVVGPADGPPVDRAGDPA